jgi:agmatine deiminase
MAWPCRKSLWGERLALVQDSYAEVARTISRYEPVTMIANPESTAEVSLKCGAGVTCLPIPHDDSWVRDSGPTFVIDGKGGIAGVNWIFNAWGERYHPYDKDLAVGRLLLERLDLPIYEAPLVTEGGAIHTDGDGTLLVVESTLLNPNRNPGKDRAEVERLLCAYTGAQKIIWLPGALEDDETDGHVDNVACFLRPGIVAALTCDDPEDGNHAALQANLDILAASTDASGRKLEVVPVPQPRARYGEDGARLALSYINFYFANGALILPAFDDPADDKAHRLFAGLFKDREVVQVPVLDILHGGGGIHCITQQQPAAPEV